MSARHRNALVDLSRFTKAVEEGLSIRDLMERFGLAYTTAVTWRRRVLRGEPVRPRKDLR